MAFWSFANRSAAQRGAAQPVAVVDPSTYDADMRRAYDHGRLDERSRRRGRGFGLLGFLLVLVAALGVILIASAIREGSFSAGGAVVDNRLDQATSGVAPAIDNAAAKTGTAMENAGQDLKDQGAAIAGQTPENSSSSAP